MIIVSDADRKLAAPPRLLVLQLDVVQFGGALGTHRMDRVGTTVTIQFDAPNQQADGRTGGAHEKATKRQRPPIRVQ
jgi:hypothetical protein